MINLLFSNPLAFFIAFPTLLLSITIHEFAHCWVTDKLGDPTPRSQDRITLNPKAHLDPLGVLALLFMGFGWGKPAPFDPYNLKEPVRDTAIIAAAGPISNIAIALIAAILLKIGITTFWVQAALFNVLTINIVLAVFNLLPVYPLDGSKILTALLPSDTALEYENFMRRYGMFVLLLLLMPWGSGGSPVSQLLSPIINVFVSVLL